MSAPKPDENGIRWYGSGARTRFKEGFCAEEVWERDSRWPTYYQCKNKATHGEFCKRHHVPDGIETWYQIQVSYPRAEILAVEFAGSTDSQLIRANGRRENKFSNYYEYYSTWEKAKEALIHKAMVNIAAAEAELQRVNNWLAAVKALADPTKGQ